jgi:S-adenosylmethionine:tRNA ribosyltransferase-isomerase
LSAKPQDERSDSWGSRADAMSSFLLDFHLPPELIAQDPIEPRDAARLLVVNRAARTLAHHHFRELPSLLAPGDLLVFNDTRVLPARLFGHRQSTGGHWEGLFLKAFPDGSWEMLCQTRGHLREGEAILVESPEASGPAFSLTLLKKSPEGRWRVQLSQAGTPQVILERYGHVPLPHYIRKGRDRDEDRGRYQTVFAKRPGAVAAPTAGLHFTPQTLASLRQRGIDWTFVTLHVGLGTFRPIETEDYTQHAMHAEWGELPELAVQSIRTCKARGGRVVAVGTTAVRVLETAARGGDVRPWSGETDLFIYPPYRFRVVDALVTNFHLPRTTLLLLVGALAGVELVQQAYAEAIARRYRFFSYGDAMLIV